jgi:hypothetical protein
MSGTSRPPLAIRSGAAAVALPRCAQPAAGELEQLADRWSDADSLRRSDTSRCYVCGGLDDGACHGVDGERAECPWY